MDIKKADRFIRNECLSYQLPKDKQQFDDEKGEVLDFLNELWDYKLMWEEFNINEGDLAKVVKCIKHRYEQKYFLKGVR